MRFSYSPSHAPETRLKQPCPEPLLVAKRWPLPFHPLSVGVMLPNTGCWFHTSLSTTHASSRRQPARLLCHHTKNVWSQTSRSLMSCHATLPVVAPPRILDSAMLSLFIIPGSAILFLFPPTPTTIVGFLSLAGGAAAVLLENSTLPSVPVRCCKHTPTWSYQRSSS